MDRGNILSIISACISRDDFVWKVSIEEIEKLEQQIDKRVYEFYNLTSEEIKIVEGKNG